MRNATINVDYYQVPAEQMPAVAMPDFFIDYSQSAKDYISVKSEMLEIFTTYFHSEQFKERNEKDTYLSYVLYSELNQMFDDLYLAQMECKRIVQENEIKNFSATLSEKVKEEMDLEKRLDELRNPKKSII